MRQEKPRILEEKDTQIAELHADFIQADRNAKKLENDLRNMQVKLRPVLCQVRMSYLT